MNRRRRLVRKGFTLIELMIVVTIVGLLARIAIPRVNQFRLRARATKIVGDLEVMRTAALDRKSTRLNSSHSQQSRMPSSA